MSRDLRPPLRRMRLGLIVMNEAEEIIKDWVEMINDLGIDCG